MYILTDRSLSQVPSRQHDFKEVSLESRRENYQNESRKFEHSLVWRLVLFSLRIYARSSTYLFTQFHRSWPGGYSRNNWKGVEGQESYFRNTQIPYHYYHLFSLSLLLSLSLSLLLLFVADSWRVSPLYFHRSRLLTFISINSAHLSRRLFEFLRVHHSLAKRYQSVVVSIRFGEKWAFFQSSGNIALG